MRKYKYFACVTLLLIAPFVSRANFADTVKLFGQVKSIESSSGDLIARNPNLRDMLNTLYQSILDSFKEELAQLQIPQTTSVVFSTITPSLAKGSLQNIVFSRSPSNTSSPINFSVETDTGHSVGSLTNNVISNSISWQVADNFATGRNYQIAARNRDDGLLGRSNTFTVSISSATSVPTPTPTPVTTTPEAPVIPAADIASADVNRGSIGYWSFDGNSNSCATKGGASTAVDGRLGSGLGLNGADAYCVVANNRIFYPKYFTLALWAKSAPAYSSGWNNSNWFVSSRDQSGYNIGPVKDTKNVQFTILDDSLPVQTQYVVGIVAPADITGWHHYAMTYDGTVANVYLDGALITSTTTTISRNYVGTSGTRDMYFGLDNVPGQPFGAGTLDEVRLYNRALTTCEIQILAGKGCGGISGLYLGNNIASVISVMESTLLRLRNLLLAMF